MNKFIKFKIFIQIYNFKYLFILFKEEKISQLLFITLEHYFQSITYTYN